MFVAVGWQLGFEHPDLVQLEPREDAAYGGATEAGQLSDLDAGPALAPKQFDALHNVGRRASRRAMRTRTAVSQPDEPLQAIAADPLGCALAADPVRGCRLAERQAQPLLKHSWKLNSIDCKLAVEHYGMSSPRLLAQLHSTTSASQFLSGEAADYWT